MGLLCNYQGVRQCRVILVFDAYRVPFHKEEIVAYNNIHVVYTKEAETADAYIEKTSHEIAKDHRVRVATSDGMEQLIVLGQGALRLSADSFHTEVMQAGEEIRETLRRLNRRERSDAVAEALRRAGRATVKAFGVRSRFVHLEFFCLAEDKEGLGKKGDFVGLEVNMRPAGGYTPDMMNYAHSTDVYQIWADMVTTDRRILPDSGQHCYCVYAGRRDCYHYVHSHEEVMQRYGKDMVMCERMPEMMVPQMGNQMYTVKLPNQQATEEFIHFVQER